MKNFRGIRAKLISQVSIMLVLMFVAVLAVVGYLQLNNSERNLDQSEQNIQEALISQGRILIQNNAQALRGMAEDNAYTAVQALVADTVKEGEDIVYGIYMADSGVPWVKATPDNPSGRVTDFEPLVGERADWAASLGSVEYRQFDYNGEGVYEFAAPVSSSGEILGHIRYGLSTQSMQSALREARREAEEQLVQTLAILGTIALTAILVGFIATRRLASRLAAPINELTQAASTIAEGDYSSPVEVETNDEIGVLATNFDSMRQQVQKKIQDLGELNSTGEVLAASVAQQPALEEVLRRMNGHTCVHRGSVYLMDKHDDQLLLEACQPLLEGEPDQGWACFRRGEGIMGICAEQEQIIFVPDTSKDERYVESPIHAPEASKALLCVPLLDGESLLGVMSFSGAVDEVIFEDTDYEFAYSIARLLVITLKNIRMRETIEEQNRTLEQKVEQRTADLAEKTNDIMSMLGNMHQGLFTIMQDGRVHSEYAAYLETIFETRDIAGRSYGSLLFDGAQIGSDTQDQTEVAVNAILGEDEMMFDCNSHALVNEYTLKVPGTDRHKILELDWDPIVHPETGDIDKIMVTVRDVTDVKALEAEAEEQKRELEMIGQILNVDIDKFSDFVETGYRMIEENRRIIEQVSAKDPDTLSLLFRNMHTVKGNARTYGFTLVMNAAHDAEQRYDAMRKDDSVAWEPHRLLSELDSVAGYVRVYDELNRNTLKRESRASEENAATISREALNRLFSLSESVNLDDVPESIRSVLIETQETIQNLATDSLEALLSGQIQALPSLAKELDKMEPEVKIQANGVRLHTGIRQLIENTFTHLFRNSMDHGIETPREREAKGKNPAGQIVIDAFERSGELAITLSDDGRGLALRKIREKAIESGQFDEATLNDPREVAQLIFHSGLSTADEVTKTSGRGVGMDAVKKYLEEEGCRIELILTDMDDTDWDLVPFYVQIRLPLNVCTLDVSRAA